MSELLKLAKLINTKIKEIELIRNKLEQLAIDKATASANYDRKLAVTIIQLKNGGKVELDGVVYEDPPVTLAEKVAKGACWQLALERDKADGLYKANVTNLSALESQLNGYQSINRYLAETE